MNINNCQQNVINFNSYMKDYKIIIDVYNVNIRMQQLILNLDNNR